MSVFCVLKLYVDKTHFPRPEGGLLMSHDNGEKDSRPELSPQTRQVAAKSRCPPLLPDSPTNDNITVYDGFQRSLLDS